MNPVGVYVRIGKQIPKGLNATGMLDEDEDQNDSKENKAIESKSIPASKAVVSDKVLVLTKVDLKHK